MSDALPVHGGPNGNSGVDLPGGYSLLCGLGEASPAQWQHIAPPVEEELADLASSAPPMRGLEYLSVAVLRNLWGELAAEVSNAPPNGTEVRLPFSRKSIRSSINWARDVSSG